MVVRKVTTQYRMQQNIVPSLKNNYFTQTYPENQSEYYNNLQQIRLEANAVPWNTRLTQSLIVDQ